MIPESIVFNNKNNKKILNGLNMSRRVLKWLKRDPIRRGSKYHGGKTKTITKKIQKMWPTATCKTFGTILFIFVILIFFLIFFFLNRTESHFAEDVSAVTKKTCILYYFSDELTVTRNSILLNFCIFFFYLTNPDFSHDKKMKNIMCLWRLDTIQWKRKTKTKRTKKAIQVSIVMSLG